ncbi:MAG: ATP-dependent helicase C-terminal domain-containing protein [Chitinispirillaceae bacterium]|jgi:ATP-dependent helicase HrpB
MLPILTCRQKIRDLLFTHKKLIVTAPPGTGKSTQIPQFFAGQCSPDRKIIMLEPRRIAARSLAYRVAEEMGCECGNKVGYQVRFERKVSEKTEILFLTYGTFLQLLHSDPLFTGSSIVVFDEFHERSLDADIALAWVRSVMPNARRDLEIIVLSATLEIGPLQKYLEGCAVIEVLDQAFTVDLRYQPPVSQHEFLSRQVERALMGLIRNGEQGSVLVFLPGVYEIERTAELLYDQCKKKSYRLMQLHGRMSLAQQQEVLRLPGREPCVILSTNVAETSLTVPGITGVIDSGLARIASYDPERERNTLYLNRISLHNAKQRAGRAGRLTKGVCIRLWAREDERTMPAAIEPEVLRLDLAKGMLTLCALTAAQNWKGGRATIELPTPPPEERWSKARDELVRCGAILSLSSSKNTQADRYCRADVGGARRAGGPGERGNICRPELEKFISTDAEISDAGIPLFPLTELGRAMSRLPIEPAVAAILLQSRSHEEVVVNAAMAAIWENSDKKLTESSDLFELADGFLLDRKITEFGREASETMHQLEKIVKDEIADIPRKTLKKDEFRKEVTKVWMRTFSHRIAVRAGEGSVYTLTDNRSARLVIKKTHDYEKLFPPLILALAIHEQAGGKQARKVTIPLYLPIELPWISDLFPDEIKSTVECRWDEVRQRVLVEELLSFRGVAIERHEPENKAPYRQKTTAFLAEKLVQGAWDWKKDDPKAEQFVCRLKQAAAVYPEMNIPQMAESDWELIYHELSEGKCSLEEIKKTSVLHTIKAYIGQNLAGFIERKAPESIPLPSGKKGRITYFDNAPPELSARLGDLIGYKEHFTLMDGRVQGSFDILAPNYRTVQKTADLGSFWKNVYPSIKNSLKRKYPKHPWP